MAAEMAAVNPCCMKSGLKRGPWTAEEDQLLINYVYKEGEGKWRTLPKKAGLRRCGKSCRLRWKNYLRPSVKRGQIASDEEDLILRLHRLLGNRWSLIAGRIPGRTDNEIKNYWNTHLSKKLLNQGIDPRTHKPLNSTSSSSNQSSNSTTTNKNSFSQPQNIDIINNNNNTAIDDAAAAAAIAEYNYTDTGTRSNECSGNGGGGGGVDRSTDHDNDYYYYDDEDDDLSLFMASLINEADVLGPSNNNFNLIQHHVNINVQNYSETNFMLNIHDKWENDDEAAAGVFIDSSDSPPFDQAT